MDALGVALISAGSALFGAAIGGASGIIGTVLSNRHSATLAASQRAFEVKRQHKELITELYETVQAGTINLMTARAGLGKVDKELSNPKEFARMTLYSSEEVKKVWDECMDDLKKAGDPRKVRELNKAMRKHIEDLERELLS